MNEKSQPESQPYKPRPSREAEAFLEAWLPFELEITRAVGHFTDVEGSGKERRRATRRYFLGLLWDEAQSGVAGAQTALTALERVLAPLTSELRDVMARGEFGGDGGSRAKDAETATPNAKKRAKSGAPGTSAPDTSFLSAGTPAAQTLERLARRTAWMADATAYTVAFQEWLVDWLTRHGSDLRLPPDLLPGGADAGQADADKTDGKRKLAPRTKAMPDVLRFFNDPVQGATVRAFARFAVGSGKRFRVRAGAGIRRGEHHHRLTRWAGVAKFVGVFAQRRRAHDQSALCAVGALLRTR